MTDNKSDQELLNAMITGYRQTINERYQYANIQSKYELPPSFTEERVQLFRNYFLDYIYPEVARRDELNEAFESLDSYIKQPEKLLRVLLDSGKLLFKYGRHLPRILGAGLKALKSFRAASHFENRLVEEAIANGIRPPFDQAKINQLIQLLSRKDLETFIENSQSLFETLHDRSLIQKVKEIVEYLIAKMKQRPKLYSEVEIRGLEIGLEIVKQGDHLFDQLDKEDQERIFEFVIQMERDVLDELF